MIFLDTNVIAYAYDVDQGAKHQRALEILSTTERAVVSTQVLLEVFSVLTKKIGVEASAAREAIDRLSRLRVVPADDRLVRDAIRLASERGISHWNAMIVVAAVAAGCERVLTEDLADGEVIAGVRIENPFARPAG